MGNVIRGRFGERKPETPTTKASAPQETAEGLGRLIEGMGKVMGIESVQLITILNIRLGLGSLKGHVSPAGIARQRLILREYTDEQLCDFAKKSGLHDWSAKPAFYHALVAEIESRPSIK